MAKILLIISVILVLLGIVLFLLGSRRKTNGVDMPSIVVAALIIFILGVAGVCVSAFMMIL